MKDNAEGFLDLKNIFQSEAQLSKKKVIFRASHKESYEQNY